MEEYFRFLEDDFHKISFDEFMAKIFSIVYVQFNEKKWKFSTCNCGWSQKNYIFRHVIDIAVKKNFTVILSFPTVPFQFPFHFRFSFTFQSQGPINLPPG